MIPLWSRLLLTLSHHFPQILFCFSLICLWLFGGVKGLIHNSKILLFSVEWFPLEKLSKRLKRVWIGGFCPNFKDIFHETTNGLNILAKSKIPKDAHAHENVWEIVTIPHHHWNVLWLCLKFAFCTFAWENLWIVESFFDDFWYWFFMETEFSF